MLFLNVYLDGCLDGFNLFYSWNIYNNCIIEDFFFFSKLFHRFLSEIKQFKNLF